MEEDDAFIPYLESLLEVSIVEDSASTVTFSEAGVCKKSNGSEKNKTANANGAALSDPGSSPKANLTNVPCTRVGEQVEVQGVVHAGSESLSKSNTTSEKALDGDQLELKCREVLLPKSELEMGIGDEERQMYDSVFKDLRKVMYLRLHCTVCDCHIGCTPAAAFTMASHKILRVLICMACDTFYGNGNFPCGDDGSEIFCRWCGQGGQLFCCNSCPSVFCKKCIRRNLGKKTVQMIEESSDWKCFWCSPLPIREHRALCWGLSKFLKEQSKAENKIPPDVAEKCPGFNSSLCCQGEKHAYYRAGQPLRNLIPSAAKNMLKVKDIHTLMSPSSDMNILRNTLTMGREARSTTSSSIMKMSSNMDIGKVDLCIPVSSTLSSLQSCNVVTRQAPSIEATSVEYLMPVKSLNSNNVPESAVKICGPGTPFKRGAGVTKSILLASQKQPLLTYESAFLNHLAQSTVQNQTLQKNESSYQNSAARIVGCVADGNPCANLRAPQPSSCIQVPVGTAVSARSNPSTGPTVNKVYVNKSKNYPNLPLTLPSSSMSNVSTAQYTQRRTVTSLPTYHIVSRGPYDVPKFMPVSSFYNPPLPSSGHTQISRPPYPKIILQKNVENVVSGNSIQVNDIPLDDDNDITEVFSNVESSNDSPKIACEWLINAFRKADHTSRVLAYHVEVLRQKFVSEMKGKDASVKCIRQLAGKYHRLLVKASRRLNFEKEFLSKEFSDWLNGERARHGISASKERGPNSSPTVGNISDTETTQEPELLLDMEISCESDHEDVSNLNSGGKQDLIECNETLSDNDSDSEDPFSDSEGMEKGKLSPVFRPFFSCTGRELSKDNFRKRLILQLLTEYRSKTVNTQKRNVFPTKGLMLTDVSTQTDAPREVIVGGNESENIQNKKVSSAKEIQFINVSTQMDAPRREVTVEENESESTQNKKVSSTREILFINVSTQTDAPRREVTVEKKESKITQDKRVSSLEEIHFDGSTQAGAHAVEENKSKTSNLKQVWSCAYTDFLAVNKSDQISSNFSDLSLQSDMKTKFANQKPQMETSSGLEDKTGDEKIEKGQTPCKNNSIGSAQISKIETETNSILMNRDAAPIHSESVSDRSRKSVAVKRKYQCIEACSDKSPAVQTGHSCDTLKVALEDDRANNGTSHSSSSSVLIPERTKVDSESPFTDYTALANSAVQKKLIKPCFVSVVKLNGIQ